MEPAEPLPDRTAISCLPAISCFINEEPEGACVFTYKQLKKATKRFQEEIGSGGYGSVYRGRLRDRGTVAVKVLQQRSKKSIEQFNNEVEILSSLCHPNLVAFYGSTKPQEELLLVYEFVPNRTVAFHLHDQRRRPLSLSQRIQIAIETAEGLSYLHSRVPPIIHRDVKTENMLLDNKFHVKIADFGLCRLLPLDDKDVLTMTPGTMGYQDPEYTRVFKVTDKNDVYSFGVVLLELITRKKAVDVDRGIDSIYLDEICVGMIKNGEFWEFVDPAIRYSHRNAKGIIDMVADLAYKCLQPKGDQRPPMLEVLRVLEDIRVLEETSRKAPILDEEPVCVFLDSAGGGIPVRLDEPILDEEPVRFCLHSAGGGIPVRLDEPTLDEEPVWVYHQSLEEPILDEEPILGYTTSPFNGQDAEKRRKAPILDEAALFLKLKAKAPKEKLGAAYPYQRNYTPVDYGSARVFSYEELEEATDTFNPSRLLDKGGSCRTYRGKLRDGQMVAVKEVFDVKLSRLGQLFNKVTTMQYHLRHENLVTVYGCTFPRDEKMLLVCKFVPNGNLADHLHGDQTGLTWAVRMRVAIQTAKALAYLHALDPPVIHCDVKSSNILLDDTFHFDNTINVEVAGFTMRHILPCDTTRVSSLPRGTVGYQDPECSRTLRLSNKSDVYSFGVVLAELISGQKAVDVNREFDQIYLDSMFLNMITNNKLDEFVDPRLEYHLDNNVKMMIISISELARQCLQPKAYNRPSIAEVLNVLEGIAKPKVGGAEEVGGC